MTDSKGIGEAPKKISKRVSLLALAWVLAVPNLPSTNAQEQDQEKGFSIEEFVVMARRKAESLQDAPVAITAISAEGLLARNVTRAHQISEIAPNVVFEPVAPLTGSTNNGSVYIRGIGTTEFSLGTEPAVGVYVDDVYLARTIGNVLDIIDVEAIEVLRGPQGTLFGRNSVGGAIVVRSKRPAEEFAAKAMVEYGTDNLILGTLALDIPITDTLRTRFSVRGRDQDGYVNDIAGRSDFGAQSSWAGRGTIEWQATDALRATVNLDYTREENSAAPYVLIDLFENDPITGDLTFAAIRNAALGCEGGVAGNTGGSCVDQFYIRGPLETVFGYEIDNPFINDFNKEPFQSLDFTEVFGSSLTLELDLDAVNIKSVTAYRQLEARNPRNADHTPFEVLEANSDLEQSQFSQELQVSGNSFDDRLDWITGFYYLNEEGYQLDSVNLVPVTLHSGGAFENESWAIFAQSSFDITDRLELTAGIRYTKENKNFTPVSDDFIAGRTQLIYEFAPFALGIPDATFADPKILIDPPIPLLNNDTPLTFSEWTPHVSLSYDITDEAMVYASYSRGYKAGGFEQRIAAPVEVAGTFGVETVDSYELGLKSTLFDNTLRLNGAAFFTDYAALQCPVVVGIAPTFINCGDATIKGFELEANWTPTPEWLFDFAVGYTDAGFKEGQLTPLASTVGINEDNAFQMVPEWTLSAAATYLFSLGKNGVISPRVDWSYKSEIFRDAANTAVLLQPGYHLVNVSLAWTSDDDRYRVAVTGRNVGDVNYLMAGVQQNNGGFAEGVFNRGAVWTINATVTY